MADEIQYHMERARSEKGIACTSEQKCISDAHMKLAELHLGRAKLLREVQLRPVGNVTPIWPNPRSSSETLIAPELSSGAES
jgi:hypothetical protein